MWNKTHKKFPIKQKKAPAIKQCLLIWNGGDIMDLIIHKHYNDKDELQKEMDDNANNGDRTIAYLSGGQDILDVIKELIKTEYKTA